ncbi:DUF1311 domain-containing protein [Bradyrhizobium genosp. L]|uniref:lysozyme inhibitor LprI family protein n=1 Tax=Bradyrhizobium genosp. L TaxID=83637 RepID=UPI0018A305D7|nr:lysozyme inhibitor LprI family protein [Bradyrhizobium genosp. L]QPF83022.1 DUF1311 domain-containing protein [Bradyrhizobium genosp. L]
MGATLAIIAFVSPARAIDCHKASSTIEHMICADKRLQKADADMGGVYASLLNATGDTEIRDALVASQRRWLSRRDERLGQMTGREDAPDEDSRRGIVLQAIQDRTRYLARRSDADPKLPRLVEIALEQRRFTTQFSGGPFAGFETSCDFLPANSSYSYGCFSSQRYQNGNRVCILDQDWASGSVSEKHAVAEVVDGRLKTIATCSIGGGDENPCPDAEDPSASRGGWNSHPSPVADAPPARPLPRLDADVSIDTDAPWLRACLTSSRYPPSGMLR